MSACRSLWWVPGARVRRLWLCVGVRVPARSPCRLVGRSGRTYVVRFPSGRLVSGPPSAFCVPGGSGERGIAAWRSAFEVAGGQL